MQVHYLVRENLLEIDNLRYIQDEFYKDLHECFGLEKCLREANLMDGPPQVSLLQEKQKGKTTSSSDIFNGNIFLRTLASLC